MKAHEIITQILLANGAISARVADRVFHIAKKQKATYPAIIINIKRIPKRTKDGIYAYTIKASVYGVQQSIKELDNFEEEINIALEGQQLAGRKMTKIKLVQSESNVQDDFERYYTYNQFEFEINV